MRQVAVLDRFFSSLEVQNLVDYLSTITSTIRVASPGIRTFFWTELVPAILGILGTYGFTWRNKQPCECHEIVTRLAPRRGARKGIKVENSLKRSVFSVAAENGICPAPFTRHPVGRSSRVHCRSTDSSAEGWSSTLL